jgi:chaperonin GroEL
VAAGANPEILRGGIEKAVEVAVAAIKERAKEISGRGEISRVGAISARSEGGDTVGKLAEALDVEPSELLAEDTQEAYSPARAVGAPEG